eukprot:CAMPEP_0170562418 /NCGR_PEP_ID=MMETSP0211-20121228/60416_1 /TAXON_ID=311385 /ORGANISM="Pseudokeronopsis sp., Strain OXSARD2" /LENGTH=42 /DNA_ID= /DNA_START= /DNA_END= /DNA_ORIENTATION=
MAKKKILKSLRKKKSPLMKDIFLMKKKCSLTQNFYSRKKRRM